MLEMSKGGRFADHPAKSSIIDLLKTKTLQESTGDESLYSIFEQRNCFVTYVNPISYFIGRKKPAIFSGFDYITMDGFLLAFLLRLLFNLKVRRRSFDMTSIARVLFKYCEKQRKSVYFVGSDENAVRSAVFNIKQAFPQLPIAGFRNGFFKNDADRLASIQEINLIKPDYLIVGMGSPLQEEFLMKVKSSGWDGVGFTCGAFIQQTAGGLDYYPNLINKFNLRFFYRLFKEPHHRKRVKLIPVFPFIFLFDVIREKFLS